MDKALKILVLFLLCISSVRAQILSQLFQPTSASTPSLNVACSGGGSITTGTTLTVTLPSCKTAGDLVVVFIGTQNAISAYPTNWAVIDDLGLTGSTNWTGAVFSDLLTSAEVTAGSVSFTLASSGVATYTIAEFSGAVGGTSTAEMVRGFSTTFTSPTTTTNSVAYAAGDLVLGFASGRNNGPIAITEGTQLSQQTNTAGSAVLNAVPEASGGSSQTISSSYGTWNPSGVYNIAIVIKGGSFTPESIPGLEYAFDAACITRSGTTCSTPTTGTTLTTWFNNAGAGGGAQTANGTCTFNTAQLNGQPAVTFNGSSCFIGGFTANLSHTPIGFSGFAVFQNASTAAKGEIFGGGNSSPAYWTCASSKEQGNDKQSVSQTASGTAACSTSLVQVNFTYLNNSGFPAYRLNEATDTTINGATSSWGANPTVLGKNGQTNSEFFNAKLGTAYWYSRKLTSAEITLMETYLNGRFGI